MRVHVIVPCLLLASVGAASGAERRPFVAATLAPREAPTRSFDLIHVRAEVEFDLDAGRMTGTTRQTFRPLEDGLRHLTLHQAELEIGAVRAEDGSVLTWQTTGEELRIELATTLSRDRSFTIEIDYRAQPRAGMFFIGPDDGYPGKPRMVWTQGEMEFTRHWLPIWDHPNDMTTTETLVTVPASWSVVSNGRLVSVEESPETGTRRFHWHQEEPHVTYLISIAAGEFSVTLDKGPGGTPLAYWVPVGREADIARSFQNTPAMLGLYTEWLDMPYPWAKYDQVVVLDFIFGGMENTSATTLTERTLHDERAHMDFHSEGLVAHELAHQWFGDLVTCKTWAHNWLNEGFATYFASLWFEHDEGRDEFDKRVLDEETAYFEEDDEEYRRPVVTDRYTEPGDLFDRHAYKKGARVLHMLRDLVGDGAFRRGVQRYLEKMRGRVAETADLRLAFEEETGRPLTWFFDQWLFHPGYPELAVEYHHEAASGMVSMRIRQVQETTDGTPIFRLPLTVRLFDRDGHRDIPVDIRIRDQLIYLPSERAPLAVAIDPGRPTLMKIDWRPPIEHLVTRLERSPAAIDRIAAIHDLGHDGSERARRSLATALRDDPFWAVRAEAAKQLGETRASDALDPLVEGLADPASKVRRAVCKALAELKDERALAALVAVLRSDVSQYARAEAAKALGVIGGEGALRHLQAALDQDSHADVIRQKALVGLGELGDPKGLAVARRWLRYGRAPGTRAKAIKALGKLGGDDVRRELEQIATTDPWLFARRAAIEALGDNGHEGARALLRRAAATEVDFRLRKAARKSLWQLGEAQPAVRAKP